MRLLRHLNEEITDNVLSPQELAENIAGTILKDCKSYLKLLGGKEPLFRGMFSEHKGQLVFGERKTRAKRISLGGIPKELYDKVNDWLKENGHIRRDAHTVIGTSDEGHVKIFGTPTWMFPIGKVNYTWVESSDWNIPNSKWRPQELFIDIRNNGEEVDMDKYNKLLHTNKGFSTAYIKEDEIWFKTKSYYYIELYGMGYQIDFRVLKKRLGIKG